MAQSVMAGCCLEAGAAASDFIADDCRVPDLMTDVIGVATDDVMYFFNDGPFRGHRWMDILVTMWEFSPIKRKTF